jgi:hypothetical protein
VRRSERRIGSCGCLHAELNALLKAPGVVPGKVLFTTTIAMRLRARKAAINANIVHASSFGVTYRELGGVTLLLAAAESSK